MADDEETRLTPTQNLVLEVLAARHRLGERIWTFDSRLTQTIMGLGRLNLVTPIDGNVERTIRASLTKEGEKFVLDPGYSSPLDKENAQLIANLEKADDTIEALRDKIGRLEYAADPNNISEINRVNTLRGEIEQRKRSMKTRKVTDEQAAAAARIKAVADKKSKGKRENPFF